MTTHAVIGINISVGNAAMQTPEDVADTLHVLSLKLHSYSSVEEIDGLVLKDLNGNRVGTLQVTGYWEEKDGDE